MKLLLRIAAILLGKHGRQVRRERTAAERRKFHRDMRARLGLPPAKALEG